MGCGYRFTLLALCLVGLCVADDAPPVKASTATWADKLKKDLLLNYDRNLRPTQYYNVTNIEVNMEIRHVDIDEDNSIFTVSGWLKMHWQDLRLKWEPSDYGGLRSFYIPSYYLWDPEVNMHSITLETAGSRYAGISDVRVESSGMLHCTVRLSQKIFCEMNFQRWPFDTQFCNVLLGKSVSTHEDRALKLNGLGQDRKQFRPITDNPAWEVTDILVESYEDPMEEEGHNFEGLQYGLVIKRKVRIFYSTILTPAVIFILMTLTSFWLPPGANEKVLLNCVTATLLCIFLRYFTIHLPLLATRTPLVVLFFSHSLYLTAISLILSVVVINIAKSRHRTPIHPYLKSFIALPGVSILVWTGSTPKSVTDEEEWTDELKVGSTARESCSSADEASQGQGADVQHEWIQLTVALERIFFIAYVFIYSVMAACYLN
ncbi:neuronal acetylcholine receptor subunit non-alpha-3-like isoform X1 [Culex pipiens pallens]|uniref:neuronal acetylcholine receptor subunit non-alpha-3-like isoform X1 n=1 Tax=Culex pipiens pallens TaxID=42434 RepID=UPI0022AB4C88|nr:neuronal acetylcholine receptor subunit non-alpha-3-like isoform X1 [Culex pipiens pallens]